MTAERTTPAMQRAGIAWWKSHMHVGTIAQRQAWQVEEDEKQARKILTAALTDPDDPDFLARTLFVLHYGTDGAEPVALDDALREWTNRIGMNHRREHWRTVADGFRTVLTGQAS